MRSEQRIVEQSMLSRPWHRRIEIENITGQILVENGKTESCKVRMRGAERFRTEHSGGGGGGGNSLYMT